MSRTIHPCLLLAIAFLFSAPVTAQDKPAADSGAAKKEKKVEPVDFRKLKELFPAEVAGLKRARAEGQRMKLGDFSFVQAEAVYENPVPDDQPDDAPPAPSVNVTIMDYAATETAAGFAALWADADIDQEGDSGYQKTLKVSGHPAYETYDREGKSGSLQIYVAKRYIVNINLSNLPAEKMQDVAKAIQIEKLAALK